MRKTKFFSSLNKICIGIVGVSTALCFAGTNTVNAEEENVATQTVQETEATTEYQEADAIMLLPNIFIDGVDIGGKSIDAARDVMGNAFTAFDNKSITLVCEGNETVTTLGEVGYSTDLEKLLKEASYYGNKGNYLQRFRDTQELSNGSRKVELETRPELADGAGDKIAELIVGYNREATPASFQIVAGEASVTPETNGIAVKVDETVAAVKEALSSCGRDENIRVDIVSEVTVPEATSEVFSHITDVLGSFTTNYQGDGGRMANVENATKFINGSIVMPGDTFDVNATIEPYTEENGYYYAAEYSGGKVVQGLGGGICQVSTTLYNAVLWSELEVVQRQNHSMTVGYVELSMDAAIAGDVKNFVFRNNSEYPIYILGATENGQLTFAIYGCETRPENRKIEFESRLIETIAPPAQPVETVNPALAPGERRVTQKARNGYIAELWKHIYVDGELVESVQVNSSTYNAGPEYADIGPDAPPAPEDPQTPDEPETPEEPEEPENPEEAVLPVHKFKWME